MTAKQIRVLKEEWGVGSSSSGGGKDNSSDEKDNSTSTRRRRRRGQQAASSGRDETQNHDYETRDDPNPEADNDEDGEDEDEDDSGDGWFEVLQPQSKVLACGDRGDGKSGSGSAVLVWCGVFGAAEIYYLKKHRANQLPRSM